MGPSKFKNIRP